LHKPTQQWSAFLFGVVFVIVLLTLAIFFPNPTAFQYTIFRSVLSLAAAGVAAMIPGFISLSVPKWLRAGGALAVFVIVYFYNPAALIKGDHASPVTQTSFGNQSPNVNSSGSGPVTVQPGTPPAKPEEKKK